MKVAILGYGKMGHIVEKVLLERRHEVVAVIDKEADWQRLDREFRRAEVAIDFSEPGVAVPNMLRAWHHWLARTPRRGAPGLCRTRRTFGLWRQLQRRGQYILQSQPAFGQVDEHARSIPSGD